MRWIETSAQLSARSYLGGASARLIGLHGLTFIRPVERHKFIHIRSIVAHASADSLTALVDVHAEITSEKSAMGWHLDGKASAVLGTHTHIQTADERILPGGTAFLTDAGACGSHMRRAVECGATAAHP